ncbi:MAG: hypothetical protein K8E66_09505 [Phycisphaerales bacterium]|nr:hypothetical protein [Phycisphaerales bacterium]
MDAPTAIAWILPEHAAYVTDAISLAGLELGAVGCPTRGETQGLADQLGVEPLTDLRAALASTDASLAILTAAGRDSAPIDARTVQAAEGRGVRLATTGPFTPGLIDAAEHGLFKEHAGTRPANAIHLVPRTRRHPVFRAASEVIENFGPIDLISVESNAPPPCGALPSALLAAIDTVLALVGVPELVDAAAPSAHKHVGDLSGHFAALLRFPDGRAGQISASDRAAWGWRATLTGAAGRLTLRPSGFDWFDAGGNRMDEHRAEDRWRNPAEALAASLRELIEPSAPRGPAIGWIELLSTAEAALLSTRTGQAESPATILRAAHSTSD